MMRKRERKAAVFTAGVAAFFAFGACANSELRASAGATNLQLTSSQEEEFTKSDGSGGEASRDASVHDGMPRDDVGSDSRQSEATQQAGQAAPPDAGSSEVKPSDSTTDGTMGEKKVEKKASKKQKKRQVRTEKSVESTETAPAEDPHAGHGH